MTFRELYCPIVFVAALTRTDVDKDNNPAISYPVPVGVRNSAARRAELYCTAKDAMWSCTAMFDLGQSTSRVTPALHWNDW